MVKRVMSWISAVLIGGMLFGGGCGGIGLKVISAYLNEDLFG